MAATVIRGYDGDFTAVSTSFRCNRWTLRRVDDINDATGFTRNRNTTYGQRVWELTASGYAEFDDTGTSPGMDDAAEVSEAITLTADTGCTFAANFCIGSIEYGKDTANNDIVLIRAISDGDLTETWDETGA